MKLPVDARNRIREMLKKHPGIAQHLAAGQNINKLSKVRLLALAERLGIDAKAIVEETIEHGQGFGSVLEESDTEKIEYSERWPGFVGKHEFEITFEGLDAKATRKAKGEFTYTPEWEYFDLKKRAPYVGNNGLSLRLFVLSEPDPEFGREPEWRAT